MARHVVCGQTDRKTLGEDDLSLAVRGLSHDLTARGVKEAGAVNGQNYWVDYNDVLWRNGAHLSAARVTVGGRAAPPRRATTAEMLSFLNEYPELLALIAHNLTAQARESANTADETADLGRALEG
jgi:hypothetical protein